MFFNKLINNFYFNIFVFFKILFIARKRLIWIITMMAAGVNGKAVSNSGDLDDDIYDGEVVSRFYNYF